MWKRLFFLAVVAAHLLTLTGRSLIAAEPSAEQLAFFEKEVRPILANHCYECHSGQAKRLEAGLRLDSRQRILSGGDSGASLVPGEPSESLLISAIRYEDFEMPPSGKLPPKAVAALEKWVAMGAPWPSETLPDDGTEGDEFDWRQRVDEHWCWQPVQLVDPPEVNDGTWPSNPIDPFILSKLEEVGLSPAKDADRRTLIRRIYYDLIGLPPTPEQVHAYLNDDTSGAYKRVVEELLESPHFGEKWARHWLDLVRYGETLGHEFDYPLHHAYRYRDYVIRAWNADVPYDQFVHEHIAGDLLPNPRLHPTEEYNESIIGTGFWYLGEACHAPTDVRQDEADRVDNQIDVFSKTFLGLTVACARCHDHKFDPIPSQDYYGLYGYIQSSRRQEAFLDPHGEIREARGKLADLRGRNARAWKTHLASVEFDFGSLVSKLRSHIAAEDESAQEALKKSTSPFYVLAELQAGENFQQNRRQLKNKLKQQRIAARDALSKTISFVDFGKDNFDDWYFTGEAFQSKETVAGEVQQQASAPFARRGAVHSGLYGGRLRGVLRSPTFELPAKRIHYKLLAQDARIRLIVDGYTMDEFNALLFKDVEKKRVNTQGRSKWVTQSQDLYHYVGHRAHIEIIDHNDGFAAVEQIRFSDDVNPIDEPHGVNLAALESDAETYEELLGTYRDLAQDAVRQIAEGSATNEQIDLVNALVDLGVLQPSSDVRKVTDEITALNAQTPAPLHAIALTDGDAEEEYVFIRGNHRLRGEEAPRRIPVAIGGEGQKPDPEHSGRLDMALKITDPSNQLTSRVIVNRLWHHLFGRGIVPTVDDFGRMGQPPSHPALLDWLAHDFIHHQDWSLKGAIKQIVMSRTYRMSSTPATESQSWRELDPENKLLHRAPVRRLTGEAIRDTLLQLSGRLDSKMFGPSIPQHLTTFMEGRGRPRKSGPRDGEGRRSLYIEVRRNFLSPMMLTFDRPSPFSTMGRRSNSNVPAQSLLLMNDPFVKEQAKGWAAKIMGDATNPNDRIGRAFEAAYARKPSKNQLQRCREFLDHHSGDDKEAWTDLCHTLINMKPFIFIH